MFHQAETAAFGDRNQRRGRCGQQDLNQPEERKDTRQHARILHSPVGGRSEKVELESRQNKDSN